MTLGQQELNFCGTTWFIGIQHVTSITQQKISMINMKHLTHDVNSLTEGRYAIIQHTSGANYLGYDTRKVKSMHFLKWLYEEKISMCQYTIISFGVYMASSKLLGTSNKIQARASKFQRTVCSPGGYSCVIF